MSTKAEASLTAFLEPIEPRFRILVLAKVIFDLSVKELAALRIEQLQNMIRRRLTGDLKLACKAIVKRETLENGLDPAGYLVVSRNYGGRYPVSRGSIWRWLKAQPTIQVERGGLYSLGLIGDRMWDRFESAWEGVSRTVVRGAPIMAELFLLMDALG
jgi:hypothetical protein